MTQKEYASALASTTGISIETINKVTSAFGDAIAMFALEGASVAIPRFGTFYPVKTDEYISVDEERGVKMLNPPTIKLEFRPSVILRKKMG